MLEICLITFTCCCSLKMNCKAAVNKLPAPNMLWNILYFKQIVNKFYERNKIKTTKVQLSYHYGTLNV